MGNRPPRKTTKKSVMHPNPHGRRNGKATPAIDEEEGDCRVKKIAAEKCRILAGGDPAWRGQRERTKRPLRAVGKKVHECR